MLVLYMLGLWSLSPHMPPASDTHISAYNGVGATPRELPSSPAPPVHCRHIHTLTYDAERGAAWADSTALVAGSRASGSLGRLLRANSRYCVHMRWELQPQERSTLYLVKALDVDKSLGNCTWSKRFLWTRA